MKLQKLIRHECQDKHDMSDVNDGKRITFRLSGNLANKLEEERERRSGPYKVPRSEVIRTALEQYLTDEDDRDHIILKIPSDLAEKLETARGREPDQVSRSKVVRTALEQYLTDED
ncbi:ribbon-helix-helix protein, CopG family [Halocatena halophila]|uniref:ribbon-helix-helix protein, CopG family n=1 Tax=Halocatena halophila TaxID=2814576 RepID=UPI002ED3517F